MLCRCGALRTFALFLRRTHLRKGLALKSLSLGSSDARPSQTTRRAGHPQHRPPRKGSNGRVGHPPFQARDHLRNIVITLEAEPETKELKSRPHRNVRGLPRYMTDIPQPIPEQVKPPDAPKTARNVECFRSFTNNSTMMNVVTKCWFPIFIKAVESIFRYDVDDGSLVAIGTADLKNLLYINHIENSRPSSLLQTPCPEQ